MLWLSDEIEEFLCDPDRHRCKFPWSDDYTVDRNFWLRLVRLDPARKGWLTEEVCIYTHSYSDFLFYPVFDFHHFLNWYFIWGKCAAYRPMG